eukprot:3340463-Pyramimonas_sp.AAC.2
MRPRRPGRRQETHDPIQRLRRPSQLRGQARHGCLATPWGQMAQPPSAGHHRPTATPLPGTARAAEDRPAQESRQKAPQPLVRQVPWHGVRQQPMRRPHLL